MSVLILGKSGTGKEHIAEKIHKGSKRADKPFVPLTGFFLNLANKKFDKQVEGFDAEAKKKLDEMEKKQIIM